VKLQNLELENKKLGITMKDTTEEVVAEEGERTTSANRFLFYIKRCTLHWRPKKDYDPVPVSEPLEETTLQSLYSLMCF
jgi:hypothetical protein